MKKTILLLAAVLLGFAANAQTIKEADVPAGVKAAFTKLYPAAKVKKWEKENGNYEAEFDYNKVETSVLIGPNNNLLETEIEIKVAELPKAVSDYCTKNMPGKKIKEASKITSADGKVSYEAEVDEADYIFDASGTFIKKEVENDTDKD
jgi:hypothetical protein